MMAEIYATRCFYSVFSNVLKKAAVVGDAMQSHGSIASASTDCCVSINEVVQLR